MNSCRYARAPVQNGCDSCRQLPEEAFLCDTNSWLLPDPSTAFVLDVYRPTLPAGPLPLKTSLSTDFVQSAQASCTAQAGSYLQSLGSAKKALLACLDVVSADGDLMAEEAATSYIALLLGFVNHYTQGAETPTLDPDTEFRLAALRNPGSAEGSSTAVQLVSGNASARKAVDFQWQEVLLVQGTFHINDAVYELASILVCLAVYKQRQAVHVTQAGKAGSTNEAAIKAYNLLRSAAGLYQCAEERCASLLANICASADCKSQVLKGHTNLALAEAQSITVLRAIQKGNAPGLIAGLASDTMQLYQSAAQHLRQALPDSQSSKSSTYADWQALVFQAYAFAYTGAALLPSYEGGKAVRCAQEAVNLCKAAGKAAAVYDQTAPRTVASEHQLCDAAFTDLITTTFNKCKRDNDVIYYKHIPEELPAAAEPKRLTTATPFILPAPAPEVLEGIADACFAQTSQPIATSASDAQASTSLMGASQASVMQAGQGTAKAGQQPAQDQRISPEGTACWRWLLVILAAPLLLIISVVGIIVWLLLLPLKICCCPVGMLAQLVWDAFEWLIKAPLRGLLWASGKPWKPDHPPSSTHKRNSTDSQV